MSLWLSLHRVANAMPESCVWLKRLVCLCCTGTLGAPPRRYTHFAAPQQACFTGVKIFFIVDWRARARANTPARPAICTRDPCVHRGESVDWQPIAIYTAYVCMCGEWTWTMLLQPGKWFVCALRSHTRDASPTPTVKIKIASCALGAASKYISRGAFLALAPARAFFVY